MKNANKTSNPVGFPASDLSFIPLLDYLVRMQKIEQGLKSEFLKATISEFTAQVKGLAATKNQEVAVRDLFAVADQTLSFALTKTNCTFNLYTNPIWSQLFFIKHPLPGILENQKERASFITCVNDQLFGKKELLVSLCYKTIWERLVDLPCLLKKKNIISYQSVISGQCYYYQLLPEPAFIIIIPKIAVSKCRQILEEIDETATSEEDTIQQLKRKLPLSGFSFSGFGKFTVSDITVPHIIKQIDRQVESSEHYANTFSYIKDIREALSIVSGNNNLKFGLLPMFELNGQFIFSEHFSELDLASQFNKSSQKNLFDYLMNVYRLKPNRIYLKEIADELAEKYEYLKVHKNNGIRAFALLPIFYHGRFVGVLEVVAKKSNDLSKSVLSKLEMFFPVLSAIFNKSIENLRQNIEDVIKTKFTSLQPSVMWRFNEAAYRYLYKGQQVLAPTEIEDIEFNKVYPLYGAIDIKNSTVNRNCALREDAIVQLNLLEKTVTSLLECTSFGLLEEKLADCKRWKAIVGDLTLELPEGELDFFFENDMYSFLNELTAGKPEVAPITGEYFSALIDTEGQICAQRRKLEASMNMVIGTINDLVDDLNVRAQKDFPCFFEKFRTDGVEYDIYVGQSIVPDRPFNNIFIKNIRLLQLTNMVTIAHSCQKLQISLPVPVEITQLIFVNPNFIDIHFRRDERRFDVEGAYNIRYHIVKKRIDKVLIKNSSERLTSPGKIAIVYTNQREADEYMTHIHYLQAQLLLKKEIEILELEQLQGVIGLKALRVTIDEQLKIFK